MAGLPDVGRARALPKRVFGTRLPAEPAARRCRNRSATSSTRSPSSSNYGVDQLRYFFLREVPFGQDGNYSHDAIVGRINADLANDLGNLAQRSLSMIAKNCEGAAGCRVRSGRDRGRRSHPGQADGAIAKARTAMHDFALRRVLADIWGVIAEANRLFRR